MPPTSGPSTTCRSLGAERVTVSYDLNRDQLLDLVDAVPPAWLEVVIHQHMPMFHMEHCVFCAVLSPGTNKTQLRPAVRRARGEAARPRRHGARAARPTSAAATRSSTPCRKAPPKSCRTLLARGLRDFRIELLTETRATKSAASIGLYHDLLAGRIAGKQVWQRLQASNRVGVTRGTLEERRNPLAIL